MEGRTEKVDIYEDMYTILKKKYIEFANEYIQENSNIDYQACLFSSIVLTTLKFIIESDKIYTANEIVQEEENYIKVITSTFKKDI